MITRILSYLSMLADNAEGVYRFEAEVTMLDDFYNDAIFVYTDGNGKLTRLPNLDTLHDNFNPADYQELSPHDFYVLWCADTGRENCEKSYTLLEDNIVNVNIHNIERITATIEDYTKIYVNRLQLVDMLIDCLTIARKEHKECAIRVSYKLLPKIFTSIHVSSTGFISIYFRMLENKEYHSQYAEYVPVENAVTDITDIFQMFVGWSSTGYKIEEE